MYFTQLIYFFFHLNDCLIASLLFLFTLHLPLFFTSNSERSHLIKFSYSFNNNQYLCSLFLTHSSLLSRSMKRLNFSKKIQKISSFPHWLQDIGGELDKLFIFLFPSCFHHWHQSTVVLSENNVFILCHVPPPHMGVTKLII